MTEMTRFLDFSDRFRAKDFIQTVLRLGFILLVESVGSAKIAYRGRHCQTGFNTRNRFRRHIETCTTRIDTGSDRGYFFNIGVTGSLKFKPIRTYFYTRKFGPDFTRLR